MTDVALMNADGSALFEIVSVPVDFVNLPNIINRKGATYVPASPLLDRSIDVPAATWYKLATESFL